MPGAFSPTRIVLTAVMGAMLLAASARATHEVNHRYTVWGEVLYMDGTPAANETIALSVRGGVEIGKVTTNEKGRYRVVMHVHDDDNGKYFDMTVKGVTRKVEIEFDPSDEQTERGKRVDFTVTK